MHKLHITIVTTVVLLFPSCLLWGQGNATELRLLRENRRLQEQVDSLRRIVESLGTMDELWADLTGIDDSGWGEGISTLGASLQGQDRLVAGRLASVFPMMGIAYHPSVGDRLAGYGRGRNAVILSRAFSRLRGRMDYFRKVFAEYGVPEELIPLCVVESAVSREAVSKAGAVGMWQLMPDTARGYGLRVDREEDDRYSVERSTVAAAKVLRDLQKNLGSWPLAVMAYNCGAARVRKAVIQSGTSDPWEVLKRVPAETKAYLPSLLAVGYLLAYGKEYGIE